MRQAPRTPPWADPLPDTLPSTRHTSQPIAELSQTPSSKLLISAGHARGTKKSVTFLVKTGVHGLLKINYDRNKCNLTFFRRVLRSSTLAQNPKMLACFPSRPPQDIRVFFHPFYVQSWSTESDSHFFTKEYNNCTRYPEKSGTRLTTNAVKQRVAPYRTRKHRQTTSKGWIKRAYVQSSHYSKNQKSKTYTSSSAAFWACGISTTTATKAPYSLDNFPDIPISSSGKMALFPTSSKRK